MKMMSSKNNIRGKLSDTLLLNADKMDLIDKLLSDRVLDIVNSIDENDIAAMCAYYQTDSNDYIVLEREASEEHFNRKLATIIVNLIKNQKTYVSLHRDGYISLYLDPDKNIEINILDFFCNDYNFEKTDMDNNTREFTFYYQIKDVNAEFNQYLMKGRVDLDISLMYIPDEDYEENTEEELKDNEDGFEIEFELINKIYFNKYITDDYNNDDYESVLKKEIKLLNRVTDSLDDTKINDIISWIE